MRRCPQLTAMEDPHHFRHGRQCTSAERVRLATEVEFHVFRSRDQALNSGLLVSYDSNKKNWAGGKEPNRLHSGSTLGGLATQWSSKPLRSSVMERRRETTVRNVFCVWDLPAVRPSHHDALLTCFILGHAPLSLEGKPALIGADECLSSHSVEAAKKQKAPLRDIMLSAMAANAYLTKRNEVVFVLIFFVKWAMVLLRKVKNFVSALSGNARHILVRNLGTDVCVCVCVCFETSFGCFDGDAVCVRSSAEICLLT